MENRLYPNWQQLNEQNNPLTDGERALIQYLDNHLPKDPNWKKEQGLKNYNGWLIFAQPFLNGARPDIIIFNPYVGIVIYEVKDWNLDNYEWKKNSGLTVNDGRGTEVYGASASMVFVGNTDHSVPYMLRHSDLFDALPKDYYDTAFLDRMHAYLPGWEVQKLRNDMFSSDYGFIVDYLAEVLKELRKEDRTNDFSEFFELSDTITTRDKTSIAKTYAGLSKVIYPTGRLTLNEAKELLDFSIECRKRVKEQLRKMDETFEKVDFSYSIGDDDEKFEIKTLEEIEYGDLIEQQEMESDVEVNIQTPEIRLQQNETPLRDLLNEGQKIIRDNQSGISYDNLFGAYLLDATKIKLVDPYIRLPYQLRNFMEFVRLVSEKKDPLQEVELHLITTNSEEYLEGIKEKFDQMIYSLESMGINFTYEFDDFIHDRSIQMDNGWKIVLGRGLDIWQKTGGYADITDYIQERRLCKACEITFVKQ